MKKLLLGLLLLTGITAFGQNLAIKGKIDSTVRHKIYDPARMGTVLDMLNAENATITASGTNTYTATLTGLTGYPYLTSVRVYFANANTTTASLNINGLGVRTILKDNGAVLAAGDIPIGATRALTYNGTNFILGSAGASGGGSYTAANGLSLSGSQFRLGGGALTSNTTIPGAGFSLSLGTVTGPSYLSSLSVDFLTNTTFTSHLTNWQNSVAIGNKYTQLYAQDAIGTQYYFMYFGDASAVSGSVKGFSLLNGSSANLFSVASTGPIRMGSTSTSGYVWTATDAFGTGGWSPSTSGFTNPMTTTGDLITATSGGTATRIPIGLANQVLTSNGTTSSWAAPAFINPMSSVGDVIIGTTSGVASRLGLGTTGQVLTSNGTTVVWQNSAAGFTNPMTTAGDLILATSGGAASRLPIGANNYVLTSNGTTASWAAVTSGFTNPMTTTGDLILATSGGAASRLAIGANTFVLTSNGTTASWAAATGGFTNPMTTAGDLILATSGGTATRLAIGANTFVLTSNGTTASWQASASGFTNPMTTRGDVITATTSGVAQRLALGTSGQVLASNGTDVIWQSISGGAISGLTTNRVPYATSSTSIGDSPNLTWDNTNKALTIGNATYPARLYTQANSSTWMGYVAGNLGTSLGSADGFNTGFGWGVGASLTTTANFYESSYNTLVGYGAGQNLTIGSQATFTGFKSGNHITTGTNNTAYGASTILLSDTGHDLDAFGVNVLKKATGTAYQNGGFGSQALGQCTTCHHNYAFGFNALGLVTTGYGNSAFGSEALEDLKTGSANTAMGYYAGLYNHGDGNVYIGFQSGNYFPAIDSTGSGNTYVGTNSGPSRTTTIASPINNAIGIGGQANPSYSYSGLLGSADSLYRVKWGIGGEEYANLAGSGLYVRHAITVPSSGTIQKGVLLYTSNHHLYARIQTTNYQLDRQSGSGGIATLNPTALKTSSYTAVAQDLVTTNTTSGAITITLPTAPTDKTWVYVKMTIQGSTNATTVAAAGSDVFNKTGGSTSISLPYVNQGALFQYSTTGAIWYVLFDDLPPSAVTSLIAASGATTSFASANGLAGTITSNVATLSTTVTGILKGNGTAISAAVSGTDLKTINGTSIIGSGNITVSGGGITNGAANNEMMKSDGTNAIASGIFSTSSGIFTTGTWQATAINPTYGGTGVNNGSSTITLAGNLITSGANPITFTSTGTTSITLPTTGTLATLSGTETFANKTLTSPIINTPLIRSGFNRQTASYTVALSDEGKDVEMNVSSANNVTIPPNSSVAFPIGSQFMVSQYGAGATTVAAGAGVTIRSDGGALKINGQYGSVVALKVGTDEWYLWGDFTVAGGGGGITNSAANTELMMSDGTNATPSGLFKIATGSYQTTGSATMTLSPATASGIAFVMGSGTVALGNSSTPQLQIGSAASSLGYGGSGGTFTVATGTGPTATVGVGASQYFLVQGSDAATNTVTPIQRVTRVSSSATATGFGLREEKALSNASNVTQVTNAFDHILTTTTNGSETAKTILSVMNAGSLVPSFVAEGPNFAFLTTAGTYGGGVKTIYIPRATTAPSTTVGTGGVLYVNSANDHLSYYIGTTSYDLLAGASIGFASSSLNGQITSTNYNDWYAKADYVPNNTTITTGTSATVSNAATNAEIVVLWNPATLISTYTITMPSAPVDGQHVVFFFGGTVTATNPVITTFTVSANSGQSLMQTITPSTANAGDSFEYYYKSATTTWYRKML